MPRTTPLHARDLAIATRLAKARGITGLDRSDLAKLAHVDLELVRRIEFGRVALRYGDAEKLLPALVQRIHKPESVNPLWLAEGIGDMMLNWPFLLPPHEHVGVEYGLPFSQFVNENRELLLYLCVDDPETVIPDTWLHSYVFHWLKLRHYMVHFEASAARVWNLTKSSAEKLSAESERAKYWLSQIERVESEIDGGERGLTIFHESVKSQAMTLLMPGLLERLKAATVLHGSKSKLAAHLGVSLASLSQWLSGDREPGGETTLRLLQWVEQQEVKQNAGGMVPSFHSPRKQPSKG